MGLNSKIRSLTYFWKVKITLQLKVYKHTKDAFLFSSVFFILSERHLI